MYVRVPENRLSFTIIKGIFADGKAIPPLVIVPSIMIIVSWFYKNMTKLEVVIVSLTSYTNKGICMI